MDAITAKRSVMSGHNQMRVNNRNLFIFLLNWLSFTALSQNSLNNGLVAYYPFNGNAKNEVKNDMNGNVYGANLTMDRFGNPNSAYHFDNQSYIKLDIPSSTFAGNYSISYWVAFNDFNRNYPTIIWGEGNYITSHGLGDAYGGDKGKITFYHDANTSDKNPYVRVVKPHQFL